MSDRTAFVRATWVNVLGNLLKIVVEGGVGLAFGSLALLADAVHSVADLLASVIVLVWGRLAFVPPDADHPHGHERIEPLTALFVGATLVALGAKLLHDSVRALLGEPSVEFSLVLVAGLAFAALDMLAVYWYTRRANRDLASPALTALAADSRNDVYTTVAAGVGVAGVAAGYHVLDPIAGAVVSVLVLHEGVEVARENVAYLVGSAPSEEVRNRIRTAILDHDAVEGVHDLQIYYIGPELEVEYHAEIDGGYTLREAHDIETELNDTVRAIQDVGDVHTHLDPSGLGEWKDADDAEGGETDDAVTGRSADRDGDGPAARG